MTLDFDGSVLGTGRAAEGAAGRVQQAEEGAERSYYPLFATGGRRPGRCSTCTTGRATSTTPIGAEAFMERCVARLAARRCRTRGWNRAWTAPSSARTSSTGSTRWASSTPRRCRVERFTALKSLVEDRRRWRRIDGDRSFFEPAWKPRRAGAAGGASSSSARGLRLQAQGVRSQLDLFAPTRARLGVQGDRDQPAGEGEGRGRLPRRARARRRPCSAN